MQEFSAASYKIDHPDRLKQKVVAPELKTPWFQMREGAYGDDRDLIRAKRSPYLGNKSQSIHIGYFYIQ